MDSSTGKECEYLTSKIGDRLQTNTGSAAIERFTGSQILKFKNEEIEAFKDTALVHLVSSFVASILVGENCPIDYGDGSGMNMLNLNTNQWDEEILDVIDPLLKDKLLPPVAATSQVGGLSPYFEKYGLKAGTPVVVWTGDNPSSLIGMGAHNPGTVVISLGTSDTFFAAMETFRTDDKGYGHVFGNPAGGCMSLICFKNGSLAREEVKKQQNVDWDYFGNQALTESQPGNGGNLLLPYFVPEITPLVNEAGVKLYGDSDFCSGKASPASYIRAVLETQFQSMFLHSQWIGEDVSRIRVTGGASQSNGICQVIADVFQSPVEKINTTDSAALGGALRAAQAVGGYSFDDLAEKFTTSSQIIQPRREFAEIYKNQRNDLAEKLK
jgi:xylulokinase